VAEDSGHSVASHVGHSFKEAQQVTCQQALCSLPAHPPELLHQGPCCGCMLDWHLLCFYMFSRVLDLPRG
jgi:hypothetical protein